MLKNDYEKETRRRMPKSRRRRRTTRIRTIRRRIARRRIARSRRARSRKKAIGHSVAEPELVGASPFWLEPEPVNFGPAPAPTQRLQTKCNNQNRKKHFLSN